LNIIYQTGLNLQPEHATKG